MQILYIFNNLFKTCKYSISFCSSFFFNKSFTSANYTTFASVKFNELVKEENEEKALAGAEGEVN